MAVRRRRRKGIQRTRGKSRSLEVRIRELEKRLVIMENLKARLILEAEGRKLRR